MPSKNNKNSGALREKRARKKSNITVTVFFCAVVIGIGVYSFIAPKPTYSESEKRMLARMPELTTDALLDGSFTDKFDLWFSDTFPSRDKMVDIGAELKKYRGLRAFTRGGITIYGADDDMYSTETPGFEVDESKIGGGDTIEIAEVEEGSEDSFVPGEYVQESGGKETASELGGTEEAPSKEADGTESAEPGVKSDEPIFTEPVGADGPAGEKRGSLYVVGNTALELFKGSETSSKVYAEAMNTYAKYLPETVRLYSMVVPTHTEFALPLSDRSVSNEQRPLIDTIRDNLDERVTFVDPYNKIRKHYEDGEYLYFRTDHHWTALGAYYAYSEFCETIGEEPIDITAYETGRIEPFLGTFYQSSRDAALRTTPDFVEYYKVDIPCTVTRYDNAGKAYPAKLYYTYVKGEANSYLAFMGGDFPYIKIVNDENKNGKRLIIFKESYGNPLIPFLVPHFEEVHVADIRYFPYNAVNFINQYGITDAIFVNGLMSASTSARVKEIYSLLNK